jgi:enediyne biosynthesis protein E3
LGPALDGAQAPSVRNPVMRVRRLAVARMTVRKPGYLGRFTAGFKFASPAAAQRTTDIASTFLAGYNILAEGGTWQQVRSQAGSVPRYFRPFFYEGAAMGFGPFSWHTGCGIGAFESFANGLSPGTVYQNYVGFGWWLGTIYHRRPRRIARIVSGLDFRYRLLCYEGIGFRAGFLSAGRQAVATCVQDGDTPAVHVWYQGYGRSLWFVYMGDIAAAVRAATTVRSPYARDCISGLGVGVAYSYLDRIADLEQICREIPAGLLADFEQGLSFGWEARQLADSDLFGQHTAVLAPELRADVEQRVADVHRVRDALLSAGDETDFYIRWRRDLVELRRAAVPLFPSRPAQSAR